MDTVRYMPKLEIFQALKHADRPLSAKQINKLVPHIPNGTITSSLFTLEIKGVVKALESEEGKVYRAIVRELPEELMRGRLRQPMTHGRKRGEHKMGKIGEVMLTLPLPNGQTATLTQRQAWALYESLQQFFDSKTK